jgi:predicted adenine nucleotide alpha hydrolase (AANH) superfamily ATPase
LSYVEKLAGIFDVDLEVDPYRHEDWLGHIKGFETKHEKGARCVKCFDWSLGRTASFAEKLGINNFSTTLTVSPHKTSWVIFEVGNRYPGFESWNFKKQDGFKRSIELSDKYDLYRQNYCGCEFSVR